MASPQRIAKLLASWRDRHLPDRVKTMLLATGVFLLFGSLIVLASALFINHTKDRLVEVSREEVHRIARESTEEIQHIIAEYERRRGSAIGSLAEVANDPGIKAQMRIMSNNGAVVLSAMIDNEGNCIYQTYGDGTVRECPVTPGESLSGMVPETEGRLTWELEFREYPAGITAERVPVRSGDKTVGFIEYGIAEGQTLRQLDPISNLITNTLVWMSTLVVGVFGAALLLLHLIWNHHHSLERRHKDAQHLATIGTLASGLAHEIRNPLHAMNLHLDAAREDLEDGREDSATFAASTIKNVQTQISNLNNILSSFMNYALPDNLEKQPVRLAAATGEVVNLLQPEFESRGVRIERDLPQSGWIQADPTALRQVLTNILLNAAQAVEGREERVVRLGAVAHEAGRWTLVIDDSGPGIPEGKEEEIFEVFVSGRKGGTGFGLPIARRIMAAHNGTVTARNRSEGGARFMLEFEAAEAPEGYKGVSPAPQTVTGLDDKQPAIS